MSSVKRMTAAKTSSSKHFFLIIKSEDTTWKPMPIRTRLAFRQTKAMYELLRNMSQISRDLHRMLGHSFRSKIRFKVQDALILGFLLRVFSQRSEIHKIMKSMEVTLDLCDNASFEVYDEETNTCQQSLIC